MANELDQRFILVENDQFLRAKKANGTEGAIVKLNASDKAEFEAAPVVGGSELTTEVVVDAKVLVETQRATASEASIQANVDAEAALRVSGDAATLASAEAFTVAQVSAEATSRTNADASTLASANFYTDSQVSIEASQRQLDDAATLLSANSYTDSQISIAQGNVSAVEAALAQEILDRIAADSAATDSLESYIDQEVAIVDAKIDQEILDRVAADSALQTQIDNVLSNVDGTALNSLSEIVTAFQQADASLNGAITALSTGLSADIATEEAARIAADSALQGEIDAEEIARAAADTTLQNNINSEASARQSGDDALDARLDVLEAVVFVKEKQVVDATVASSKVVTLGFTPKASSLSVFIGRLALHQGDDYTLSGAVVTFIGTIAGASGIKTGDNLYFTFSK